eukprot:snap_masked-scaffold_11-processed-gene-11.26-mRNA-1 protein AED:1.00 eAED:1.00 QI:0/-1/0/0/-1/1/1/0/229
MGADGGTRAVSRRYTPGAQGEPKEKNPEGVDRRQKLKDKSSQCAYSGKAFEENMKICCCKLGYLYIKEEILRALLEKSLSNFPWIKRLKDLQDVTLKRVDGELVCAITDKKLGLGNQGFVALKDGRLVAKSGVSELQIENEVFAELFPQEEEAQRLMDQLKGRSKTKKKKRGLKKGGSVQEVLKKVKRRVGKREKDVSEYKDLFVSEEENQRNNKNLFIQGNLRGSVQC